MNHKNIPLLGAPPPPPSEVLGGQAACYVHKNRDCVTSKLRWCDFAHVNTKGHKSSVFQISHFSAVSITDELQISKELQPESLVLIHSYEAKKNDLN